MIVNYFNEATEGRNVTIELIGLNKGLFYTIHIERILFNLPTQHKIARTSLPNSSLPSPLSAGGEKGGGDLLIIIQDVDITPDPLSFFTLVPQLNINGKLNLGTIHGLIAIRQPAPNMHIVGENIQIKGLPMVERTGISGDGTLKFNFLRGDQKGVVTFSIDNAKLKGDITGIGVLPLDVFKSVKGLLTIEDTVNVDSLTMEGKGIYVRMKGTIKESNFDGNIEIMMDSSFDLYAMLQALLERYKISTGYYVIPYTKKI